MLVGPEESASSSTLALVLEHLRNFQLPPWGDSFRTSSPVLGCWGVVSEDRRRTKAAFAAVRDCFGGAARRAPRVMRELSRKLA